MEQNQKQRKGLSISVRRSLITQTVVASTFILILVAIFVISIKNENSVAGQYNADLSTANKMDIIRLTEGEIDMSNSINDEFDMNNIEISFEAAKQRLEIDFGSVAVSTVKIEIYDIYGSYIAGDIIEPGVTALSYNLKLEEPGVYSVRTASGENTKTFKLIVGQE